MRKETSICKIHKENNIIHLQFNEAAQLNASGLNEIYEYINEVYGKTGLLKLIDIRADLLIDKKGKELLKDQSSGSGITKRAILAGKNTNGEILSVFIEMNNEHTPLGIFTDYESAINWLQSSETQN